MISKERIFEPVLRRIVDRYKEEKGIYKKILSLTEKQKEIKSQKEIFLFTEITFEKTKLFEKIDELNNVLEKDKKEIIRALKINEFTISALKNELKTDLTDDLFMVLSEIAEVIKNIEVAEDENEGNLKKVLKLL